MVAKGKRQRQILSDQKFPRDFKGMYYKEATDAIALCIASNMENTSALERALRILEQMPSDKIGTQRRITSNIDAIETFMTMLDDIDLMGGSPKMGDASPAKLSIMNVAVSVRPEIVIKGQGKSGKKLIGAIKLHFPKTYSLDKEAASFASTIVQKYCHDLIANDEETYAPYCQLIDIGSKTVHLGVKSTITRFREVEANCKTIAQLWPNITEDE